MKKILIITLVLLASFTSIFAVFDEYEASARARSLGGAFYTVSDDASSIFYNPAGLREAGNNFIAGYSNPFGLSFMKVSNGALTYNLKNYGVLGIGYRSMNVEYNDVNLMDEKTFALSYAFTLMEDVHSSIFFGTSVNFYMLEFKDFGNEPSIGVNFGALAILHQRTRVGVTITNINNDKLGSDNSHDIPRKLVAALAYNPYNGVTTSVELHKSFSDYDAPIELHTGAEMTLYEAFILRLGVRNNPAQYNMGFGIKTYNFIINYGLSTHPTLDLTHEFGVGYKF